MKDMTITCIQCQADFEFTVQEQEKFKQRGFDFPLRCPQCRKKKSKDQENEERRRPKEKRKHHRNKFDDYDD